MRCLAGNTDSKQKTAYEIYSRDWSSDVCSSDLQGQTAGTVVVQHIIAENTIDGRIMKVLSDKDSTQSALIEAVKADLQL